MAAFPLAAVETRQQALARAVPIAIGGIVLIAGALQFTSMEGTSPRLLPGGTRARPSRYRRTPGQLGGTGCASAFTVAYCCAGLTAILLVVGAMDLRAMAVVAATITVERLSRLPVSASREPSGPSSSGQGCF